MRGNRKAAGRKCIVAPTPGGRPGQADARTIARRGDPVNPGPGTSGRLPPGRYRPDNPAPLPERWHHLSGEAREILLHDLPRRAQRARDHDVLEPGIPLLHALQIGDELLGGAAEPGAVLHAVFDRGGSGRLGLASRHPLHMLFAVAQHPERPPELGVLLEVRPRLSDGGLLSGVDGPAEPQDELLAELELTAVAPRHRLVVAEPAIDELLGRGRDDALDAVPHHEVEPPGA